MLLEPGVRLGPYEVLSALGAGGMGEVWRARDRRLDRDVALKVLPAAFVADSQRLARFEREAKVLASLNHPHIGGIFGLEEAQADGAAIRALVLELVEGPTLADRIARGPIPVDEALPIARQIAEALEAAHEQGIVHRDLKPANVKIRPDGQVKVLDFGLAKAIEPPLQAAAGGAAGAADLSHSPTLTLGAAATQLGVILGTAAYMAPEQARGRPVDKRADIWAFGSVLYEMLTGERAFRGEDVSMTLAEVMKGEPAWSQVPAGTPEAVRRLLRRCFEKDPQLRLRDIGEARILLDGVSASRGDDAEPPAGHRARPPWAWIAGTAGLVAALATLVMPTLETRVASPPDERVFRYSIPLPKEELTFSHAVSPDGRKIAIEVTAEKGRTRLFVRDFDSWDLRLVTGSEGAANPFWSPDGRDLAFFANRTLKRVSVNGGPAEELCSLPGPFVGYGTWGREVIVFAPTDRLEGPLQVVAATGGAPSPITRAEAGENHQFPVFLPDGRSFLYTSLGGPKPGIYLASVDDATSRRLLADVSSAHVAPSRDGTVHLLFVRDGKVMAQKLATAERGLQGEPFVLLEAPPHGDDDRAAISTSAEGMLVYRGGDSRRTASRTSWFDRSGNVLSSERQSSADTPVALSPEALALAFFKIRQRDRRTDVWLRQLARAVETRLTYQNAIDTASNVVWAPDGRRMAFSMNVGASIDVFSLDVDSAGEPQALHATKNPKYATDWSRDGRFLLYTEIDLRTGADLWYLPLERDNARSEWRALEAVAFLRTEFAESAGQLSPDGHWIAYTSDESGSGTEVYVRPFPAGPGKWKLSNGQALQPRWSQDGRELFYLTGPVTKLTLMSVAVSARPAPSGAAPMFETAVPVRLFDVRANNYNPMWGAFFYSVSADGQRFLINHMDFKEDPVLNVVTNWRSAFEVAP